MIIIYNNNIIIIYYNNHYNYYNNNIIIINYKYPLNLVLSFKTFLLPENSKHAIDFLTSSWPYMVFAILL